MLHVVPLVALALCERWCAHPCGELNGLPSAECSSCDESHACRPGAPDFDKGGGQAVNVLPSGEASADKAADTDTKAGPYGSHGNPLQMPTSYFDTFDVGGCELETVDHSMVTREMLMNATKPFMIKGMTANWSAHATWSREELLKRHADEPFQLNAKSHAKLGDLLAWNGKYHMGHAVYPPGGCYSDPWRPYSPMLFGALRDDYELPRYLGPMVTFQMGVGSGYGIGVPPENHPSSWFAMIKGRKRWVLRPPDAGTGRNGGPGTEPPGVMQRYGGELCAPENKPSDALHCDQLEGDVIWLPDYWWHETCGLDDFSIGLGALTYDGCCPQEMRDSQEYCQGRGHGPGDNYAVRDIPSCKSGERACGGLPFTQHEGLS